MNGVNGVNGGTRSTGVENLQAGQWYRFSGLAGGDLRCVHRNYINSKDGYTGLCWDGNDIFVNNEFK